MNLELVRFLALMVGPSITAAARPAVTFLAVQLTVVGLIHYELATVGSDFAWLISPPAIVVAAVLASLESAAKHDPDFAALLRDFRVDNITGAFGAFSAALLFTTLGLPDAEAASLVEGADSSGLLQATATAITADRSSLVQISAIGGALGMNLGLTWLRSELLEFVDDFDLGKWWARLETGGVVGVLVLLPFLPVIVLVFVITFAVVLSVVALVSRAAAKLADERARVACEECGYAVREEASVCPDCGTSRTPKMKQSGGFAEAWSTLRRR